MKRLCLAALTAMFFLACGSAACPAEDKTIDLPDASVTTPFGFEEPAVDYPGSIAIIDERDIQRSNAKYVYDLLRREPGIFVSDYTQAGKTVTVDMRGFGDTGGRNVLVLVDGRRMNEIDISGTDWSQIPIENVERIEVMRGSGSVMYGDNAVAGVINIITKRGKKGHRIKGGTDFGSYRYENYYALAEGAEDFASYDVFFKRTKTDGFRLNGDYDGVDFSSAITMHPTDVLAIDMSGGYHKDWYGMPAGLQRWEIDQIGRRGSTTPNDRAKTETTFIKIAPTLHFTSENMEHDIIVDAWGRKKRLDTTTWDYLWGGGATWDNSQIDTKAGGARYVNTLFLNGITNSFNLGADAFNAENRLLTVTPAWFTYNQLKVCKRTLGLFINDKAEFFNKVILTGGYRYEWSRYVFDQSENAGRYETKKPGEHAIEAGFEYKYFQAGGVYARFSRSYRFPETDEFYSRWSGFNTNLQPQSADTWETGIKDRHLRLFQPAVNLFWMKTENEIFYDPSQGSFGENRNYGAIRRFGVESSAKSEVNDKLSFYGGYSYIKARFDAGAYNGKGVPMVPSNKFTGGLTYSPIEMIEFNLDSEYVSSQYSINDERNTLARLKKRFVTNGKVTFKCSYFQVYLGINNMFNDVYSEYAVSSVNGTATDYYPAPGRNYIFGASCEF